MLRIPRSIKTLCNFLSVHQADIRSFNEKPPYYGNDGFEVLLNVKFYQPNEISVKVIENAVVVEGKSVNESDENYISREFTQEYILPVAYDIENITSTLSADGFLQINAPAINQGFSQTPRIIEIQELGPSK